MTTLTVPLPQELTATEAAAGLHARWASLKAQLAQKEDVMLRQELIGVSAAVRILTDAATGLLDRLTLEDVIVILTNTPAIESFVATAELIAWLAEHEDWDLSIKLGDDALTTALWPWQGARVAAAEAFLAFSKGDREYAEDKLCEAFENAETLRDGRAGVLDY